MKQFFLSSIIAVLILFQTNLVNAQSCQACFTATPDSNNGTLINLDASCSVGNILYYDWYVDGLPYIPFPSPFFQIPFNTAGTHTIMLVIYGNSCIDSTTQVINVQANCNASFTQNVFGSIGYFAANNFSPTATYTWDFGDGTMGSGNSANHYYTTAGTYNVCCYLLDPNNNNCSTSTCQTVIVSGNTSTGCQASMTIFVDPLGFLDINASASTYNPLNTYFNFYVNGNLQISNGNSPFFYHPVLTNGNYTVDLVMTDLQGNVCDSISQTVFYNGWGGNGVCHACFYAYNNASPDSLYIDALCSTIPSGGSIEWTVNGSVLPNNSPTQTLGFATIGAQNISLLVKDSLGQACDSLFQVAYTYGPPCTTCLNVSAVSGSTSDYIFDATCSGSSNAAYYYFTVDNNFVASSLNPQFNYSFTQSGTYTICATAVDSLGNTCISTCQTVAVNTPTVTQYTIAGTIYKYDFFNTFGLTPTSNAEAKVYLIKLGTGGVLTAIDSTVTNAFGQYAFNNKPIDDYRVKVALETSSPDYALNIPTYYQSGVMWYDAQVVTLFGNTYGRDIYLIPGVNSGGAGFIGGNVSAGANKSTRGANVTDVTLILMDVNTNKPIAYAKPDGNGDYAFTDVPNGNYKVYGELLNRASVPRTINISSTQASFSNNNFLFNENVIQPTDNPASLSAVDKESKLNMYPNPATESFTIQNSNASREIKIFDMVGRLMMNFELKPNDKKVINVTSWTKGVYVIQEENNKMLKSNRMLVR